MATYIEHILDGVSTIHCLQCGALVTNERAHEREHASSALSGPESGVEAREEG